MKRLGAKPRPGSKPRRQSKKTALDIPSEAVELTIERLSHDGRGIAKWLGKTGFVGNALPEEKVIARISTNKSRYFEAQVQSWLQTSPQRIEAQCPHYAKCGGCDIQHMSDSLQLESKQAAVLDRLSRWGHTETLELAEPLRSQPWAYRVRARFGVSLLKGRLNIGFRSAQSRDIVDIETCPVLVPQLQDLYKSLRQVLLSMAHPERISDLRLVAAGLESVCVLRHVKTLDSQDVEQLQALTQQSGVLVYLQDEKGGALKDLDRQLVDHSLSYEHASSAIKIAFSPLDFIQSNAVLNQEMVAQAVAWLGPQPNQRIIDLFCGVGNFALPLALKSAQVIGIEGSEAMVAQASANARLNKLSNTQFIKRDLFKSDALRGLADIDAVLLDPPRAGAEAVVKSITKLKVKRVLYVSCDPATLARDAAHLKEQGYVLKRFGVMDMFPQTSHIESMALFER